MSVTRSTPPAVSAAPLRGQGIGLRSPHYRELCEAPGAVAGVDWLELITENFLCPGGRPRQVLRAVQARYPLALHGVALSLGSVDPLNPDYLRRLRNLVNEVQPALVSDHLCWGSHGGHYAHDLLPLPFTEEALAHVAARVGRVQELLGRRILIENVSSYLTFTHSHLTEWEFLSELCARADCLLLLDVNNVFVNAHNHGFDARDFLRGVPPERVAQIHLAGHRTRGPLLLDTHDQPIREEVWALYREAIARCGPVPTLVEWDDHIPALEQLVAVARRADAITAETMGDAAPRAAAFAGPAARARAAPGASAAPAPMRLAEAQSRLWTAITARESLPEALAARGLPASFLTELVAGDARADAVARADVYNAMYFLRVLDFVREDYPVLAHTLGEDAFRALCADFLQAHPSPSPLARDAGAALPAFLPGWLAAHDEPAWLTDLARLEWARADLVDGAPDARPLTLGEVQALAQATGDLSALPLRLVPTARLLTLAHRVDEVWRASGEAPSPPPEPTAMLIWRRAGDVYHRVLPADEHAWLRQVEAGTTFGVLCEHAAAADPGDAPDASAARIATALQRWLRDELLAGDEPLTAPGS